MKTIYKHLRECGYTRKDIVNMDSETIKVLASQSIFARMDIDTRLELSI